MYKLKRVYICDVCYTAALPAIELLPNDCYKVMPSGWEAFGKEHLCPKCAAARAVYKAFVASCERKGGAEC